MDLPSETGLDASAAVPKLPAAMISEGLIGMGHPSL
jgi:hypothetical protein